MKIPKKLQEAELKRLQEFQFNIKSLIDSLGKLELQKRKINDSSIILDTQIQTLNLEEISISNYIKSTYGDISIDLETGEFTYSKE
tara:strand:- start:387 stop:644 length:258 start_codon:yes stop_codon:yes gene_type:complete